MRRLATGKTGSHSDLLYSLFQPLLPGISRDFFEAESCFTRLLRAQDLDVQLR